MLKKAMSMIVVGLFCSFGSVHAETLVIDGIDAQGSSERPKSGVTSQSVESRYGSPLSKNAAVGDPPISSWEYPSFVVYFEYDRVIHAVAKR